MIAATIPGRAGIRVLGLGSAMLRGGRLGLLFATGTISTVGCGGEQREATPPQPVVVCAEQELALPDGSCIRPGVPPDSCGDEFVHDGAHGCEPILPAEPCPPGLMAVPGEDSCHSVMECSAGKWGALPVDETTQYVDGSYGGGDGDGTEARPWPTISEAVAGASPGDLIAVAAGVYGGGVLIQGKPVRLWGVCPESVTIEATGADVGSCPPSALCILDGADGTEVGGIAFRGAGLGILLRGSEDVLIDRAHVHDNAHYGIAADGSAGVASLELRDSLIEHNHAAGLVVQAAQATMDGSVVRATQPRLSDQGQGSGLMAQPVCYATSTGVQCDQAVRASVVVTRSLFEQNHQAGLAVRSSDVWIDQSVVRTTLPRASDLGAGWGIAIDLACDDGHTGVQCDPAAGATASVTRSLIEHNHAVGLLTIGSEVTMDATVVRATWPRASDQLQGSGVEIQPSCSETTPGEQICDPATRGTGTVTRSVVQDNHEIGLFVMGSDVTVEATVVRATWPRPADQRGGLGVGSQLTCFQAAGGLQCDPNARATLHLSRSLIEHNHGQGLLVQGADATVESTVVRTTLPYVLDNLFGDGIALLSYGASATGTTTNVLIEDSARAGLGTFGAVAALADTHIRCAAFALNGEPYDGLDFAIDDLGGNLCGCGGAEGSCKLVSAGLEPPDSLASSQ